MQGLVLDILFNANNGFKIHVRREVSLCEVCSSADFPGGIMCVTIKPLLLITSVSSIAALPVLFRAHVTAVTPIFYNIILSFT